MLYGYFVASGIQEKSPICCLCGFVADPDDWNEFDHEWTALAASANSFNAKDCLQGIGAFQSGNAGSHRLSEVMVRSALVPIGTVVVREQFTQLSSAERAVLSTEGIESELDLIFYNWTERIICQVHERSEKISLIFCQDPQTEQYCETFNKHLGRFLLGPHLISDLAFAELCDYNHLQAAKMLSEATLLLETPKYFPQHATPVLPVPEALRQISDQMLQQGRFDAAELRRLIGRIKGAGQEPATIKQKLQR